MVDRNEPYRQCWSFNGEGARCSLVAGHAGKHSVSVEWTDAEAWMPTFQTVATPTATVTVVNDVVAVDDGYVPPEKRKCIICDHKMHTGVCNVEMGGFGCDCANGVEA